MTPRHVSLGALAVTVLSTVVGAAALLLPASSTSVDSGGPEAVTVETTQFEATTTSTFGNRVTSAEAPQVDVEGELVPGTRSSVEPVEAPVATTTTVPPTTTTTVAPDPEPPTTTTTVPMPTTTVLLCNGLPCP